LQPTADPVLKELQAALTSTPSLRLRLIGHTDSTGTAAYNRELSLRRAQSVMDWLVRAGIDPGRLEVDGMGPDAPIADNATEAGRAQNRRVQAIQI
jgi:outer membrane protein OmpA-like peptidoglycan-associated protein